MRAAPPVRTTVPSASRVAPWSTVETNGPLGTLPTSVTESGRHPNDLERGAVERRRRDTGAPERARGAHATARAKTTGEEHHVVTDPGRGVKRGRIGQAAHRVHRPAAGDVDAARRSAHHEEPGGRSEQRVAPRLDVSAPHEGAVPHASDGRAVATAGHGRATRRDVGQRIEQDDLWVERPAARRPGWRAHHTAENEPHVLARVGDIRHGGTGARERRAGALNRDVSVGGVVDEDDIVGHGGRRGWDDRRPVRAHRLCRIHQDGRRLAEPAGDVIR